MSSQRDGWCRVDFCSSSATGLSALPRPTYRGSSTYNSLGQDDRGQFLYSVLAFPTMNPVYSPVQPGTPYGNPKNVAYTGYPAGYPTAAPTYNPNIYSTSGPGYAPGYPAGTPYKVPPTQSNNAPPPYSPSPNPYQTAMYPIRSAYPQQNLYAQGAYYTQPVYAAQPHVIHHTTVVQPNSIPSAIYPAPVAAPRANGVAMGMVAGATMAMSAGTLLTTPQHTALGAHPVSVPTYRAQGTPAYSYIPPHW